MFFDPMQGYQQQPRPEGIAAAQPGIQAMPIRQQMPPSPQMPWDSGMPLPGGPRRGLGGIGANTGPVPQRFPPLGPQMPPQGQPGMPSQRQSEMPSQGQPPGMPQSMPTREMMEQTRGLMGQTSSMGTPNPAPMGTSLEAPPQMPPDGPPGLQTGGGFLAGPERDPRYRQMMGQALTRAPLAMY